MVDVHEAQALAKQFLADELPRRWRHSAGVAARVGRLVGVPPEGRELLIAAAWLHDIGYAQPLLTTGFHPIDGARYLRSGDVDDRIINLVAHHSCAGVEAEIRGLGVLLQREFPRDESLPHDELCFCDQTTSPDGEFVSVADRLAEIRSRYADGHVVRRFVDLAESELVATVKRVEARYGLQPR